MKTNRLFRYFIAFFLSIFPILSLGTTQANAVTVLHYLPYSPSEGAVKVNQTGLLYKTEYDKAGLVYKTAANCDVYKNCFCNGYHGEYHDYTKAYYPMQRGAIDFSLGLGKKVLATADGVVARIKINDTVANYIAIKHPDGNYSYYIHIGNKKVTEGQAVIRGQVIGEVVLDKYIENGVTKSYAYHLHYAQWNGLMGAIGSKEKVVKFADTDTQRHGGILRPTDKWSTESKYQNSYISSNSPQNPPPPPPPSPTKFADGSSSSLTVSLASVTLKVCSPDLAGKKVYATNYRGPANGYTAKTWRYEKVASSSCVTFSEMDGAGNTFDNVMYYTVASLVPISDANASAKRTACWVATNHVQLCDGKSR